MPRNADGIYTPGHVDLKKYEALLISPKGGKGAKNYLEVKYRLQLCREMYPEARISSRLVELDLQAKFALFETTVELPTGATGVGYGSETAADFGDWIEKAQTKSVGRALTIAGVGHQYVDGEIEYESESTKPFTGVDSPVAPGESSASAATGNGATGNGRGSLATRIRTPRTPPPTAAPPTPSQEHAELLAQGEIEKKRLGSGRCLDFVDGKQWTQRKLNDFNVAQLKEFLDWAKTQE